MENRLNSKALGGFAVVLNIAGNPYIDGAEAYLGSFLESYEGTYSKTIKSMINQNIQINETIISQQKQLWDKIQKALAAQGTTLEELLRRKGGSKKNNVYTAENLQKEFKDLTKISDLSSQMRKKLTSQVSETEENFRATFKKMSAVMSNYNGNNLGEIIQQLKNMEGSFSTDIQKSYYKQLLAISQDEQLQTALFFKLQAVNDIINGSDKNKLTVSEENGNFIINDPNNRVSSPEIGGQIQAIVNRMLKARKALQGQVSRRQQTKINQGLASAGDFDPSRFLATSKAQLNRMKDNEKNNLIKQYVSAYHELIDVLEKEFNQRLIKENKKRSNSLASDLIKKTAANLAKGKSTDIYLAGNQNFYSLTGEAFELLGNDIATEIVNNDPELTDEEINDLLTKGSTKTRWTYIHTGDMPNRTIIKKGGAILPKDIKTQIDKIGNLTQSLIGDSRYYSHVDDGINRADLRQVEGKIDSIIGVKGTKYKIAFSDKLYNKGNMSDFTITEGTLLTNLISLDSGANSMNNKALYLLLLNLSNIASFYSESRREKAETILENLLSQNYFAAAFDPSNAEYSTKMTTKDTLYISNFSGQMVPAYTVLETLNSYMRQVMEGGNKLAKNPVKASIQYADMGESAEEIYKGSLYAVPFREGRDARWHYVASLVAAKTKAQIAFDLTAFGSMYAGLFGK